MRPASPNGVKQLYDKIGLRVKDLRLSLKMNQAELADAMTEYFSSHDLGNEVFTKNSIERFENQRKHFDKIEYIIALAEILKTDCHFLLTGIKPENASVTSDLGLSQNALEKLKKNKSEIFDSAFNAPWAFIINYLIEHGLDMICLQIIEYFEPDKDELTDEVLEKFLNIINDSIKKNDMTIDEANTIARKLEDSMLLSQDKNDKIQLIIKAIRAHETEIQIAEMRRKQDGKTGKRRRNNQET